MNSKLLKTIGTYAGILLLFIGLAYGFTPEVFEGKIVNQGDISQWKGMANEAITHNEAHPEDPTAWSNAMFGGMPTTATIDTFEGDYTDSIYDALLTGRRPASYLLLALIGGFLLMLSLGTSTLVAVGGAIAIAFCSYNFQIITAGHNTKMQAIAYLPWVMAGIIFTYKAAVGSFSDNQDDKKDTQDDRKGGWRSWLPKTILGATLFAFALNMQIKANHPQITYYLALVILAYAIGQFIYLCINKERRASLARFFTASVLLLVIGLVGIATNANKLLPTLEYSKYTMRGGSELTEGNKDINDDGLSIEYATQWSYGIEEMPNLLIPNFNGGASKSLGTDSETCRYLAGLVGSQDARSYVQYHTDYWGPQPGTAGPMYLGAITVFLFILGLILCKGREKWWLLAATILAIFISWGHHFMGFTRFCFDHVPMYNKFRTVSMALTVLQTTMPMLGFLVLDRIMKNRYDKGRLFTAGAIALALTAGFCLISWLFPGIAGSFTNAAEMNMWRNAGLDGTYLDGLAQALAEDRKALLTADAFRSLVFILIAAALLSLPYLHQNFQTEKTRKILTACVIAVVLFDLWGVGKRYLNEDNFITQKDFTSHYRPNEIDNLILQDKDPDFRVLDIPRFSTAIPSYHHKCIGGYSAVKMQRYQDLLDWYIFSEVNSFSSEEQQAVNRYQAGEINIDELYDTLEGFMESNMPICSMLNSKYIIGRYSLYENPYRSGNCWFVSEYLQAATPDEEISLLGSTDLHTTAIIGEDFARVRENIKSGSLADDIHLTYYAPNELRYNFSTDSERAAIFSEIYYPKGWKAWIEPDGEYGKVVDGHYQPTSQAYETDIFRADWILRGVIIPEGKGQLIMRFEPESYDTGATISSISSLLLILLLIGSAAGITILQYRKRRS